MSIIVKNKLATIDTRIQILISDPLFIYRI